MSELKKEVAVSNELIAHYKQTQTEIQVSLTSI